eukprot:1147521-Pelagomonas_calceolata.AAC.2
MPALQAWCRKAEWKARRMGSLPRKPKAMLDTPASRKSDAEMMMVDRSKGQTASLMSLGNILCKNVQQGHDWVTTKYMY